jgi:ADP-heptose:LPS heptosyltransferase
MQLGFFLRRTLTKTLGIIRDFLDFGAYVSWLLLDPSKFKKVKVGGIKNLLVIYGGATGDVYNAIGLMNQLQLQYPDLNIHFLTFERNRKYVKNEGIKTPTLEQTRELINQGKFDALVLLQGAVYKPELFRPKMYLELMKIPYRAAVDDMHIALIHKQLMPLLTRKVFSLRSNGFLGQVKAFNLLGFKIKYPKFQYTKDSEKFADAFIKKNKISKKEKIIFLHIGGGSILASMKEDKGGDPTHLWPLERWAHVADKLIKKHNARILFTGVGEEKILVEKVISMMEDKKKTINLVDKSSIEGTASLLRRGDLIISIDTGTAHIAAQTGIPLIDLFSSFDPKNTSTLAPEDKKKDIFHPEVCTSCRAYTSCPEGNNVCMKVITTKEILDAADQFIKK